MAPAFELGARVMLKSAPVGLPGEVIGHRRGKVLVNWSDLGCEVSHKPDALLEVKFQGERGGTNAT